MVRTQIQITEEQSDLLKQVAKEENISIAKLIRLSIDHLVKNRFVINEAEKKKNAMLAVNQSFHSGIKNISTNHDQYLTESYES